MRDQRGNLCDEDLRAILHDGLKECLLDEVGAMHINVMQVNKQTGISKGLSIFK